MSLINQLANSETIENAAVRHWQVVEARVVRYEERPTNFEGTGGQWYTLFVREKPGDDWQSVGRRRSLAELLAMVENRPAAFVECTPSRETRRKFDRWESRTSARLTPRQMAEV
jgi:hypothetical protein